MPPESCYSNDWVRIAERDLKRVTRLLEYDKDPELVVQIKSFRG
jgi:hypothetical protein